MRFSVIRHLIRGFDVRSCPGVASVCGVVEAIVIVSNALGHVVLAM